MRRIALILALGALAAIAGARAYQRFLRRPILDWGARPDEVARRLPGDELLEAADVVATRAIAIDAPPSAIWPWLIQMGPGRGGVYTYDWIENLFGLDMHSVDEIVPEGAASRFISRNRFVLTGGTLARWVGTYAMEPASLVMERKMLLGIKSRAERLAGRSA